MTTTVAPVTANRYAFGDAGSWPPGYDETRLGSIVPQRNRQSSFGYYYEVGTGLLRFDTSLVPDNEIVRSVKLRFYVRQRKNANTRYLSIDAHNWDGTSGDYVTANTPPNNVLKGVSLWGFTVGQVNEITLDATNFINKTGPTDIRLHITGGQPTGQNFLDVAPRQNSDGHPAAELVIESYVPVIYPSSGQVNISGGTARVTSGYIVTPSSGQIILGGGTPIAYKIPKEAPKPVYGPTRVGLVLSGRRGAVRMRSRLYLTDINATKIKELPKVDSAKIDLSNYRTATWKLSPQMHAWHGFDPLSDFILATTELKMDGEWHEYPRGLYTFLGHSKTHHITHSEYSSLPGESLEGLLAADGPNGAYEVTKGTGILSAVRQILLDRGIPSEKIQFATRADKPLSTNMVFETNGEGQEETWISICNELLSSGGFYALWTDELGNFVTCNCGDLENREPNLYYAAMAYGGVLPEGPYDPIVDGAIDENFEDQNFANKVVATVADDGAEESDLPQMRSIAINRDPHSPASVQNLGRRLGEGKERVITKRVSLRSATSQADLNRLAQSQLTRFTSLYHTMSFDTISDPRCGARQIYQMYVSRKGEVINAEKWRVVNFSQDLGDRPGVTTHNVARHEPFEVGTVE